MTGRFLLSPAARAAPEHIWDYTHEHWGVDQDPLRSHPCGRLRRVITEHGVLSIRPGAETEFEAAFAQARPLISAQPGFVSLSLSRSIESPNLYLMLVEWETVEAHTEGFRKSPEFDRWRELLHHFYEPKPVIEHFVALR